MNTLPFREFWLLVAPHYVPQGPGLPILVKTRDGIAGLVIGDGRGGAVPVCAPGAPA